jgi:FlaA1/EpsC-like NDP-sugar epimerase
VARVPAPLRQGRPGLLRDALRRTIGVVVAIKLVVFVLFGFYNRWWRYVSTRDMWRIAAASPSPRSSPTLRLPRLAGAPLRLPRGIAALDFLLTLAFVAGSRLLARTLIERPRGGLVARGKEVLVVGAGDAGAA